MARDPRAFLWEIQQAIERIQEFTQRKELEDYQNDAMLRAAVERNCEVIGEALAKAHRFFPQVVGHVTNAKEIIILRNQLIHGYATVRDALVWDIIQTGLSPLCEEIAALLRELEDREK